MKRKLLSIVLALCLTLTLTLLPTMSVAAGSYADTNGHWAESSIERWSAYGIIQGSNGQFDQRSAHLRTARDHPREAPEAARRKGRGLLRQ